MRLASLALAATLTFAAGTAALVPAAEAYGRRGPAGPDLGYVVAESRYGPQTIAAPVRISLQGRREVRLPGGTWIECHRSCSETLRRETIDFWHIRNNGSNTDGVGYLHYRF
ncbi:MAG: hypothetical protein K2X43_12925 [Hyphomonadaceae bacterium]|nr:hypothetical protein [Hyphomonadaceae bacterium]